MAISAVMAAVSTAGAVLGTAGGIAAFSFFGMSGVAAVATRFLVTTAMGAALNALTPKPKAPNLAGSQGYQINGTSGAALDHQVVYGEARVGGVRVYDAATGGNNEFLHRIMAFTGHEIDSYRAIYLNDEVVTLDGSGNVTSPARYNGFVRIKTYLGTDAQAADPDLVAETSTLTDGRWTTAHRLRGIAYVYVRFKYNADAFPNGVPALSVKIRGKKVYDPRTATTAWSANAALCVRDYLASGYGLDQPGSRVDDALVTAAANICDQVVDGEARYTCNGAFTTGQEPGQILTDLLTSMGGLLWYGQGKWRMRAAAYTAPVLTLDEDDLRSSVSVSTRHSRRDNFNSVKGTFAGDETDWQPADYPEVDDGGTYLATDNNVPNVLDMPLPFTASSKTAQRIARIALRRNREQLTVSASFGLRAFKAQVGDNIALTSDRFGWTEKPFEVLSWTFGLADGNDIQVQMTLREISSAVFTDESPALFEINNTTLPSPFDGLSISNLDAIGGGRTQGDGTFVNSAVLSWDAAPSAFVSHYEVEWKPTADSVYNTASTRETSIELAPLIDGIEYTFRVRAVGELGNKGSFFSTTLNTAGDTSAPGVPASVQATGNYGFISITWINPADRDLSHVEIWENTSNSLSGAVQAGTSAGDAFVRPNLGPDTQLWFFLRSVDSSGNKSSFTTGRSATTAFIDDNAFEGGIRQLFQASGLSAPEVVSELPIAGNFQGRLVFLTSDNKLYRHSGSPLDASGFTVAISGADISNGTITGEKIVANTITGGLLATSGVITNTAQINDALIDSAKIKNLAVERIKIASNAVSESNFARVTSYQEYNASSDTLPTTQIIALPSPVLQNVAVEVFFSLDFKPNQRVGASSSPIGVFAPGDIFNVEAQVRYKASGSSGFTSYGQRFRGFTTYANGFVDESITLTGSVIYTPVASDGGFTFNVSIASGLYRSDGTRKTSITISGTTYTLDPYAGTFSGLLFTRLLTK